MSGRLGFTGNTATGNYEYNAADTFTDTSDSFYDFLICPQCGTLSYNWYKHCYECGARLMTQPEPTLQTIYDKLTEIIELLKNQK